MVKCRKNAVGFREIYHICKNRGNSQDFTTFLPHPFYHILPHPYHLLPPFHLNFTIFLPHSLKLSSLEGVVKFTTFYHILPNFYHIFTTFPAPPEDQNLQHFTTFLPHFPERRDPEFTIFYHILPHFYHGGKKDKACEMCISRCEM